MGDSRLGLLGVVGGEGGALDAGSGGDESDMAETWNDDETQTRLYQTSEYQQISSFLVQPRSQNTMQPGPRVLAFLGTDHASSLAAGFTRPGSPTRCMNAVTGHGACLFTSTNTESQILDSPEHVLHSSPAATKLYVQALPPCPEPIPLSISSPRLPLRLAHTANSGPSFHPD